MSTIILNPLADAAYNDAGSPDIWTPSTGSTLYNLISKGVTSPTAPSTGTSISSTESPSGSGSSYIALCNSSGVLPAGSIITGMTLWVYQGITSSLSPSARAGIIYGGASTNGSLTGVVASPQSVGWYSYSFTQSQIKTSNGGVDLNDSQIASLGVLFELDPGAGSTDVYTLYAAYIAATYTPGGSSSPHKPGGMLGGLLWP